jgi:hypothetical protein
MKVIIMIIIKMIMSIYKLYVLQIHQKYFNSLYLQFELKYKFLKIGI